MDSNSSKLLKAAESELGYDEQPGGYTKFGEWYYANVDDSDPAYKNAEWCDMYVSWAGAQAGGKQSVGTFAYTVDHAKWFEKHGAWSSTPQPGAVVFFAWEGSKSIEDIDHVGLVRKVEGGKVQTIEGNTENEVLLKARDQATIAGYGYPWKVAEVQAAQLKKAATLSVQSVAKAVPAPLPQPEPADTPMAVMVFPLVMSALLVATNLRERAGWPWVWRRKRHKDS